MEDKNWISSTTADLYKSPQQQEVPLSTRLGRVGMSLAKGAWGIPGQLVDLPVSVPNFLYSTVTGKEPEVPSNIISKTLNFPTPETAGEVLQNIVKYHAGEEKRKELFDPSKERVQGFAEKVAENVPGFFLGGAAKSAPAAISAVKAATAATAASEGLKSLRPYTGRFGPLLENAGFLTAAHIFEPGLSPKNLEEKITPAYAAIEEKAPSVRVNSPNLQAKMNEIDKKILPTFNDAPKIRDQFAKIERVLSSESPLLNAEGKPALGNKGMTFSEAKTIIEDLNDLSPSLGGKGQHYISELKKSIEEDMKASNPELYNQWTDARDLYKAMKNYNDATDFIRSNRSIGDIISRTAYAKLASHLIPGLGGYSYIYPAAGIAKSAAKEIPAFKTLLNESSIARKHYADLIKSASKKSVAGVANNLNALGKEAEKRGITLNEKNEISQKPDKDGWVHTTTASLYSKR